MSASPAQAAKTVVIDAVDTPASVFQPANVTVEVGDTVRWEFDQALAAHTVKSQGTNWAQPINEQRGPNGAPINRTFTAPGTYNFFCDDPRRHDRLGHRPGPEARARARVLEDRRLPPRLDPAGHRGDPGARHGERLHRRRHRGRGAVHGRQPGARSTSSSSSPRPASPQRRPAGGVRALHPAPAAASSASTPRPTPSTAGPWYGEHDRRLRSATTRPERPPRTSTSRTPTSPPRRAFRPPGRATDEWYNYQRPIDPGGQRQHHGRRLQPARPSGVHVLATVDESTYGEDDGNTVDDDHPIAWCSDFDGGRIWYTGMGHTQASFSEAHFRAHLLGGLQTAARRQPATAAKSAQAAADGERLREGHARRRHAEPDGDRRRARRASLLHRARRSRADLEPDHASDDRPSARSRSRSATRTACSASSSRRTSPPAARLPRLLALPDSPNTAAASRASSSTGNSLDCSPSSSSTPGSTSAHECCHTGGSLDFGRRRQPLHLHRRQHQPVRVDGFNPDRRAARPRDLGRPAHVGQHERPERQDPAHHAARERRPARRASARRTRSRPATCSRVRARRKTLPEIYAHGLPQPVPDHGRPEDRLGPDGRLRPGRRLHQPRTAARRAASSST